MNPKIIPFAIGAVCGFAAALALTRSFQEAELEPPVETPELEEVSEPAEDPLENRSGRRIAELESEVLRLQSELEAADTGIVASQGMAFGGTTRGRPDPERMREQMLPHLRHFVDQIVMKYQGRLNLLPEQRQKLHDLLLLKQERMHAAMASRFGDPDAPAPAEEMISDQEVLDLARDFMSEEQVAEFQRVQEEERRAHREMIATARLGQIAPMLGLSESQKDAVYGVYYSEAAKTEEGFFRPVEQNSEELEKSLSEILTPEQMIQYREYQETQRESGAVMIFGGG